MSLPALNPLGSAEWTPPAGFTRYKSATNTSLTAWVDTGIVVKSVSSSFHFVTAFNDYTATANSAALGNFTDSYTSFNFPHTWTTNIYFGICEALDTPASARAIPTTETAQQALQKRVVDMRRVSEASIEITVVGEINSYTKVSTNQYAPTAKSLYLFGRRNSSGGVGCPCTFWEFSYSEDEQTLFDAAWCKDTEGVFCVVNMVNNEVIYPSNPAAFTVGEPWNL